jgi:hypothetical protein
MKDAAPGISPVRPRQLVSQATPRRCRRRCEPAGGTRLRVSSATSPGSSTPAATRAHRPAPHHLHRCHHRRRRMGPRAVREVRNASLIPGLVPIVCGRLNREWIGVSEPPKRALGRWALLIGERSVLVELRARGLGIVGGQAWVGRPSPYRTQESEPRHCCPAHIHQVRAGSGLEGVPPLVSALVHLPVSLAGPGPSGSSGPSRRCQGCSHPPRHLPDRAALSFTSLLRQAGGGHLRPLGNTAPRGAQAAASTSWSPPSHPTVRT